MATSDTLEEEEESLVLVELTGIIDLDLYGLKDRNCKIVGLEGNKPVLQLDNYYFVGEYEDIVGTAVIFEEVIPQTKRKTEKNLKYFCKTNKKLAMKRAFLQQKQSENDPSMKPPSEEDACLEETVSRMRLSEETPTTMPSSSEEASVSNKTDQVQEVTDATKETDTI
ncbi:general transcription factor 3C polypeptide 6 [Tachypleus tridentatus]|uniref:general transcription factor 3C polypeptide 6 n=1 Tax=Tachypleus tridentatus TaxID=6853 RepID=UPI003FD535FF